MLRLIRTLILLTAGITAWAWAIPLHAQPAITSPEPGSNLTTSTVTFRWSQGEGRYHLYVGTKPSGSDLAFVLNLTRSQTSFTVRGVPTNKPV